MWVVVTNESWHVDSAEVWGPFDHPDEAQRFVDAWHERYGFDESPTVVVIQNPESM